MKGWGSQGIIRMTLWRTKLIYEPSLTMWVSAKKMGQNPYRSIIWANIWWRHHDKVFDLSKIVMNSWIFFINLPWYYLTPCQNLLRLNVILMVREIGQLFKIFKILIVPLLWLIIDDVTVMLSLIVLSWIFFANSPLYYLTSFQNLLRLNFIFMVRKMLW